MVDCTKTMLCSYVPVADISPPWLSRLILREICFGSFVAGVLLRSPRTKWSIESTSRVGRRARGDASSVRPQSVAFIQSQSWIFII